MAIPAGAGKTAPHGPPVPPDPVYPRSRGEHPGKLAKRRTVHGLSPLARGNTITPQNKPNQGSVYPRSRGEHKSASNLDGRRRGLSPLARGTLLLFMRNLLASRFIPARAGNTPGAELVETNDGGLSPLARGTPPPRSEKPHGLRFIPARAGNTPVTDTAVASLTVYPRSRGEHLPLVHGLMRIHGLSPLARGTPRHCDY